MSFNFETSVLVNYASCYTPLFPSESATGASTFEPDSSSIAASIKYHAEFTPLFSPDRFDLPKAYFATAQSVRDALIINWNETYELYEKLNVKQAYYLSMEFLQVSDSPPWTIFHSSWSYWFSESFTCFFYLLFLPFFLVG